MFCRSCPDPPLPRTSQAWYLHAEGYKEGYTETYNEDCCVTTTTRAVSHGNECTTPGITLWATQ